MKSAQDLKFLTGEMVDAAFNLHVGPGPGLLVNFGAARIKDRIRREANGFPEDSNSSK